MRAVAERVTLGGGLFRKCHQIRDFKGEMGQIRANLYGAAGVVFADLDLLFRAGSLEKNKLGAPTTLATAYFLEAEYVTVKGDGFFQI